MPSGHLRRALHGLFSLLAARQTGGLSDGELLTRFADRRDEMAFEALLRRHGPMVLTTCERILGTSHDADTEDAFQATFLVLVSKARSISKRESIGSWLYRVAYCTAMKARILNRRTLTHAPIPQRGEGKEEPSAEAAWNELRPIIDAEVNRLPEKYRAPVVLCYLEGKTYEQAAQELGWASGTVSGRLAQARDMLRKRLTKRGVTLSATLLATALSQSVGHALMPPTLIGSTLRAAALIAAGSSAATGAISATVAALTKGVLSSMFITKLKVTTAVLLAVGVLGSGTSAGVYRTFGGHTLTGETEGAQQSPMSSPKEPKTDKEKLAGTWILISLEQEGVALDVKQALQTERKLVFAGNRLKFVHPDTRDLFPERKGETYKLETSKNPKQITVTSRFGMDPGIYQIDGDRLMICWSLNREKTPKEFVTRPGSESTLYVYKREASAAKPKKPDDGDENLKEDANPLTSLRAAQIEAAGTAAETYFELLKSGKANWDDAILWLRRYAELQIKVSNNKLEEQRALERHLERMKAVEEIAIENFKVGRLPIQMRAAAEYYRLEAEIWLAEAKGK